MEKQLCHTKIALKLKELGFNEKCLYSIEYSEGGQTLQLNPNFKNNSQCYIGEITIPLWEQVIDWLGDKYDIHIVITVNPYSSKEKEIHGYKIYRGHQLMCLINNEDGTMEKAKAREQAILKAIELVK